MTLPVADGCDEGKRRVSAMPNRGEEWFVVLPDDDPLTASLFPSSCRRINHTSGRPWVVGQWAVSAAVQAIDDPMAVLLFGTFSIDQLGLQSALANMSSLEQVQHLLRSTAGSFHAVIRCAGTTIVRGTLAGTRRVFTARRGGRTIAANRADILAFVLGSGVDPVRCALELAIPDLPYGLAGGSMWMGVDAIPEYSQLRMTADGRSRHERWWTPPAASLGVRQGAAGVRAALENAITARLRPNLTVSCDLSGGWDSAAICHLASKRRYRAGSDRGWLSGVGPVRAGGLLVVGRPVAGRAASR